MAAVDPFEGTKDDARSDFRELAAQIADGYSAPSASTVEALAPLVDVPTGVKPKESLLAAAKLIEMVRRNGHR